MSTRITEVSDPAFWASLMSTWRFEGEPTRLAKGNVHYKVIQNTDGEIEFERELESDLYGSTSIS